MSERNQQHAKSAAPTAGRPPITAWKKLLLAMSVGLMVVGGALYGWSRVSASEPAARSAASDTNTSPDASAATGGLVSGFIDQQDSGSNPTGDPAPPDATTSSDGAPGGALTAWSPAIFRLGFGFAAGFAIGYAIRSFLKLAIIGFGVLLIALIALQYAGVVDINWSVLEGRWDQIAGWLQTQTANLQSFVQGALPSGASAASGLVIGLKKS